MEIIKKDGSSISLVRFFEYQGKKFLIFDGGEGVDANGHVTIHICNVDMSNGVVATAVQGPDMDVARNVIKTIVNENRNGMPLSIKDLNYNDLNGIVVSSDWPLKMMPNYIDIIKMNQPTFEMVKEPVQENVNSNPFNSQVFNTEPTMGNLDNVQPSIDNNLLNQQMTDNLVNNNNPFANVQFEQPTFTSEPTVSNNAPINNNTMVQNNTPMQDVATNNNQNDYEQKYFEQLSITNRLNAELEAYKAKFEQLKHIIEN